MTVKNITFHIYPEDELFVCDVDVNKRLLTRAMSWFSLSVRTRLPNRVPLLEAISVIVNGNGGGGASIGGLSQRVAMLHCFYDRRINRGDVSLHSSRIIALVQDLMTSSFPRLVSEYGAPRGIFAAIPTTDAAYGVPITKMIKHKRTEYEIRLTESAVEIKDPGGGSFSTIGAPWEYLTMEEACLDYIRRRMR